MEIVIDIVVGIMVLIAVPLYLIWEFKPQWIVRFGKIYFGKD